MKTIQRERPRVSPVPKPKASIDEQAKLLEDWNFAWKEAEQAYQAYLQKKRLAEDIQGRLRRSVQHEPDYAD